MALCLSYAGHAGAQKVYLDEQGAAREMIPDPGIKSVQLYREGWPLSYPVTRMKADIPLVLEFDELADRSSGFSYKIIHCNADWTPSHLSEQEYLDGFLDNSIRDSRPSFNTYYKSVSYTHLTLPTKRIV